MHDHQRCRLITLMLDTFWTFLSAEACVVFQLATGLPNDTWSSDHIALMACFAYRQVHAACPSESAGGSAPACCCARKHLADLPAPAERQFLTTGRCDWLMGQGGDVRERPAASSFQIRPPLNGWRFCGYNRNQAGFTQKLDTKE